MAERVETKKLISMEYIPLQACRFCSETAQSAYALDFHYCTFFCFSCKPVSALLAFSFSVTITVVKNPDETFPASGGGRFFFSSQIRSIISDYYHFRKPRIILQALGSAVCY